jgi:Tfp pilus assembly protein PilO
MALFGLKISPAADRASRRLAPLALLTVAAIGSAVSASMFYQAPAQARLSAARASYEAARQTQVRREAARKTLEELEAHWRVLPQRKEFPLLILAISELAQRDRVKIPGMNYSFQKAEGGLAVKASITFRTAGDYADIRRFIHRLESSGPYLFIESLDAARVPGGQASSRVAFNVRVVTFLRPDQPATTGGA